MHLNLSQSLQEAVELFTAGKLSEPDYLQSLQRVSEATRQAAESIVEAEISANHPRLCEAKSEIADILLALMKVLEGLGELPERAAFGQYLERFQCSWKALEEVSGRLKTLR